MGLDRYLDAHQGKAGLQGSTYEVALSELRRGRKEMHWVWYVFPQISGLGKSEIAQHYGIESCAEAFMYLQHPVLGERYRECVDEVVRHLRESDGGSVNEALTRILGSIDAKKFASSLTLFAEVSRVRQTETNQVLVERFDWLRSGGMVPCGPTLDFIKASGNWAASV